jgi:hypothetical protein
MKAFTLFVLTLFFSISILSQTKVQRSFYFEKDQATLSAEEEAKLITFVDSIHDLNISSAEIKGYCDLDGSQIYNQQLSEERVNHCLKAFNNLSFKLEKGYGELEANGHEEAQMKFDRRVDIILYISTSVEVISEPQSIEELYALLRPKSQEFCFVPNRDTVFLLKEGSMIYLPANAFEQNGKTITGTDNCIWIKVDEIMSTSDALLYDLSTSSNKTPIESAGMINVAATYNEQPATLRADQNMTVMLPTQKTTVGNFQMFNGVEHDNDINWLVNNTPALSNVSLNDFWACYGYFDAQNIGNPPCRFFFCKIKRFLFPRRFAAQRSSAFGSSSDVALNDACGNIADLFEQYGVDNMDDLMYAMNKSLMDKYNVETMADLRVAMSKEREKNAMNNLENGTASMDDLRYMMFNTNDLGWANCDAFSDVADRKKTTIKVDAGLSEYVDVKLVFKDRNIILSPTKIDKLFHFAKIPEGETASILAIKMVNHKPQLFIKEIVISKNDYKAAFKTVTVDQMKNALKQLNA